MNGQHQCNPIMRSIFSLTLVIILVSCNLPGEGGGADPEAWIDRPLDGYEVPAAQS